MKSHCVVITGLGIIASAGTDNESFADTIISGKRALFPVTDPKVAHFNARYAGLVLINPDKHPDFDRSAFAGSDRFVKLASIAAKQAVENAGAAKCLLTDKAGVFLGTCSGPMLSIEEQYVREHTGDKSPENSDYLKRQYYSGAVELAQYFGIKGYVCTVTTACSAFTTAVAAAADLIRIGALDYALVGGADSFSLTTLAGFAGLKATNDTMCAPFSIPPGLNLGEAAGFVVLENREKALQRKAVVRGEILGSGLSNDAYHSSAPDPAGKGAAQSMQRAIDDSKVTNDMISFVSAHGTGTAANDKAETKALIRVFGDKAYAIPMSSLKGVTGHCLGAAGAVETIATLMCAQREVYPSSVGFTEPRDGCPLDYVPETGRVWKKESVFVKNNFAFGGNNASLVIGTGEKSWTTEHDLSDDPVCISGIGLISSCGIGSSISVVDLQSDSVAIEKDFPLRGTFQCLECSLEGINAVDKRIDPRSERSAQMASVAAVKALASAGIPERQASRMNIGLFMNIAQGSTFAEKEHIQSLLKNDFELSQVNVFPYIVPNSVTGTVCRMLSLTGHNATFCNGHGASLAGLAYAWAAIRNGHAPMLLCGSVDDLSNNGTLDCVLSENPDMQKMAIGEGAAMLMLEKLSHAKERGAVPLCIIRSIVQHFSDKEEKIDSYRKCIAKAVEDAGIATEQIAVVCYNKLSYNAECAVQSVFGTDGYKVVDLTNQTGYAPSSLPFFNISAVLDNRLFEIGSEKKYILSFFNASYASDCAAVFEKVS